MKKTKFFIAVCVLIFIVSIVAFVIIQNRPHSKKVNILQNGKIIKTIDLESAEDQKFNIEYKGRVNVIEISGGKIRISEADCPDHICVNTGWLRSNAAPIICLPNKLTIEFADTDTDAAT